jgi:hypothetical protein
MCAKLMLLTQLGSRRHEDPRQNHLCLADDSSHSNFRILSQWELRERWQRGIRWPADQPLLVEMYGEADLPPRNHTRWLDFSPQIVSERELLLGNGITKSCRFCL